MQGLVTVRGGGIAFGGGVLSKIYPLQPSVAGFRRLAIGKWLILRWPRGNQALGPVGQARIFSTSCNLIQHLVLWPMLKPFLLGHTARRRRQMEENCQRRGRIISQM